MKPDGANMETPEPGEVADGAGHLPQENVSEFAQPEAPPVATQKANGKPVAVDPKVKSKAAGGKVKSASSAGSSSRPGTASHRTEKDVKSSNAGPASKKVAGTTSKTSAAAAAPKRPASVAAASTAKNQTRALDKKPVGSVKTNPDATVTNGSKPKPSNGTTKKSAAEAANGARPKTSATNKPVSSAAPKPNSSTVTKPAAPASSRTTRPAVGPSTSRATSALSKPAATTKLPATVQAKIPPLKSAPTLPAGKTAMTQPAKTAAAKKDVSRPPSAPAAKKPFTATASPIAKKKESAKSTTTVKSNSAPTPTKAAEPKVSQAKAQQPAKPTLTKKPVAAARFPVLNRPPLGRTPPASPASKPSSGTKPATPGTKRGTKPTQTVSPFTKKTSSLSAAGPQSRAAPTTATQSAQVVETVTEAPVTSEKSAVAPSAVEEVSAQLERDGEPGEIDQQEKAHQISQSPTKAVLPLTSSSGEQSEKASSPAKPSSPTVASSADLPQETQEYLYTDQTLPISVAPPQTVPPVNLNEEEDEEEREGSQLVSVSEMSGTTQPTEESRPGSGGPVGGAAWKAGGGLLSELDSEDVSGSQQGASELSAPGVLEGTESTDDLGDGSLKEAIDMEGPSAGSPDFEKVPDIPANDFADEEEDDSDRVCDMEVGSERTDEPRRPRHDNDVDEDEDDDVEMASEGVTESGLESYGNADEDDFAEDERQDNLNRALQPPPAPMLPSAPAAQWDQPNPFGSPWAEHSQMHSPYLPEEAAARAVDDPSPAESETLAEAPAGALLEVASQPSASDGQEVPVLSLAPNQTQKVEPQDPAPQTSPLHAVSSEMPEGQGDQTLDGNLQSHAREAPTPSSQPGDAEAERGDEEEEAEPETLPADEVLGGPLTAATSDSSSVTEDEASDTEGEAQLHECPVVCNLTFDAQPPPQRNLSTVEEGEEAESGAGDEATPLSATSLTSYNFDSITTASSSNAQSTGESCIKSPGIFSLEELTEEAKEPTLNQNPAEHVTSDRSGCKETFEKPEEIAEDIQPPYYSAICEKTEDSFSGFAAITHPHRRDHSSYHRRDHSSYPRTFCDIVKPVYAAAASPKLTCTDLPPRSLGQQALSPQLRRLEQHQRQLLELQQRREQQSRPLEEAEQERKRRVEEEQRKKKDEAEEEIKRNKEDEEQRRELELQLQQQQQELKQRQQIIQWKQELQQSKAQTPLLSPSSGLCTIYEALESSEDEEWPEQNEKADRTLPGLDSREQMCERTRSGEGKRSGDSLSDRQTSAQSTGRCSQDGERSPLRPPESPELPPPLDLDWGKKVDMVQQLINQTLLLNGDGCSSLLLLPGGTGGTLSPLETSLWPSLLPPLMPPSATVTSVSSFSPEAAGSSPHGEWTVVELETHH